MTRLRGVFLVVAITLLAGGVIHGQDKKDDTPVKIKGQLPPNWAKLGLTDEQKQKVYKVQNDFDQKIAVLEKQIKDLKATEKTEMEKVLTDAQKARYKEIIGSKLGTTEEKKTDK